MRQSAPAPAPAPAEVPLRPLLMTILAPLIWSTGGAAIRLLGSMPPWNILFWRSLFMAFSIGSWMLIRRPDRNRKCGLFASILHGLPVSFFISLSIGLYVLSMTRTLAADSMLIQGTAPLFIIIIGRLYLKDPISRKSLFALAGITAGLLMIILPSLSSSRLSGNLFGLGKAVAFAMSAIMVRRLKHVDMVPAAFTAAVILTLFSLFFVRDFSLSPHDLLVSAYLGMVQTGIGFMVFVSWSGKIPATYTGVIVVLEAVLGPLWVWAVIGEVPSVMTLIGGAVILTSLIYNSLQAAPVLSEV
jgi:drug/metabolite transporter, DME family